jgi:hypothetical protein
MDSEDIQILRKDLVSAGFDPAVFIGNQIADVTDLEEDIESKMLIVFDGLAKELAVNTQNLEEEVNRLRETAHSANEAMLLEMEQHAKMLDNVKTAVDEVKAAFEHASEGAIKIGDRLSVSESERVRIETAVDLINFINWYDSMPLEYFANIHLMENLDELRAHCVPESLRTKDWGRICRYLGYLRRVLFDLSSEYAQKALKNILRVSEVVETSLVHSFLDCLRQLMDNKEDPKLIKSCSASVKWLHTFNSGQTLHKRYIYAVIEKCMPPEAENDHEQEVDSEDEGKGSFRGKALPRLPSSPKDTGHTSSVDFLSQLFWTIGTLCTEQFAIIENIFPPPMVPKMTRTLIQRIYNDPAFGIQRRVDNVLHPRPPEQPLPLSEYLESLLAVREKLTALYLILSDLCSRPAFLGMGRENNAQTASYITSDDFNYGFVNHKVDSTDGLGVGTGSDLVTRSALGLGLDASGKPLSFGDELADAEDRSRAELQDFLEEQISHVLSAYIGDYFEKEGVHLRVQYDNRLRNALGPAAALALVGPPNNDATSLLVPRIRPDRVRNMPELLSSVANVSFIKSALHLTRDTVRRMEVIARDENTLPVRIKEIYFSQCEYILDGVLVPCLQASANVLIKQCTRGATNTALPPMEYLTMVTLACESVGILKSNLDDVYTKSLRPQGYTGNVLAVCKEAMKKYLKTLDSLCKEGIKAWVTCVAYHMERLLSSMQAKNDFRGRNRPPPGVTLTPTAACAAVCQMFDTVAQALSSAKNGFSGLDIKMQEDFLIPLGRHAAGTLIAHLRRMKISEEGAPYLMRDLNEYVQAIQLFEVKESIDMMQCIREVGTVFGASADMVRKVVVENLRHLDTDLVLSLVKSRNDYGGLQMGADHWTRTIASTYSFTKWQHEPAWSRASNTQRQSQIAQRQGAALLGLASAGDSIPDLKSTTPSTLRKSAAPLSSLYIEMSGKRSVSQDSIETGDRGTVIPSMRLPGTATDVSNDDNEHLFSGITGPSSFAAAVNSRFANLGTPGMLASIMPFRPMENSAAGHSSALRDDGEGTGTGSGTGTGTASGVQAEGGSFRPLSYIKNALSGPGGSSSASAGTGGRSEIRNRPDLIGRITGFGSEGETLVNMAQAKLGLAPVPASQKSTSAPAAKSVKASGPLGESAVPAAQAVSSKQAQSSAQAQSQSQLQAQKQPEKKTLLSRFGW